MDSTKLIIGILIIGFFIVKTIIGDAKKERKNTEAKAKKNPKTIFPPFFYDGESKVDVKPKSEMPTFKQEGQSITNVHSSMAMREDEEFQVDVERWRRAIIDSEILKTKF